MGKMDWIEEDTATMNLTANMTKYLESLDCPISVQVHRGHCKPLPREPLVIEGCVIREDEDGFYIEYPDEYVGLIASWLGKEE